MSQLTQLQPAKANQANTAPRPVIRAMTQLRELIRSGEWSQGQKLPTEFELAGRLGVSRGTTRNALKNLQTEGLIKELDGQGGKICGRVVIEGGIERTLLSRTVVLLTRSALGPLTLEQVRPWDKEMLVEAAVNSASRLAGMNFMSIDPSSLTDSEVAQLIADPPCGLLATEYIYRSPAAMATVERLVRGGLRLVATGGLYSQAMTASFPTMMGH